MMQTGILKRPTVLASGAFLLGFVGMLLWHRAEWGLIISQFAPLWHIAANRPIILALLLQTILVALVPALAVYLLYVLIQERQATEGQAEARLEPSAPVQASHHTTMWQPPAHMVTGPAGYTERETPGVVHPPTSHVLQPTRVVSPAPVRDVAWGPTVPPARQERDAASLPLYPGDRPAEQGKQEHQWPTVPLSSREGQEEEAQALRSAQGTGALLALDSLSGGCPVPETPLPEGFSSAAPPSNTTSEEQVPAHAPVLLPVERKEQDGASSVASNAKISMLPVQSAQEQQAAATGLPSSDLIATEGGRDGVVPDFYLEIRLLKTLKMRLVLPERHASYEIAVNKLRPKARMLIAYLAYHRADIRLDDLRTHVFATEETDRKQTQDQFSTEKREIHRQLRAVVEEINKEAGEEVIPAKLALFDPAIGRIYALPAFCRVDLPVIDAQRKLIDQAEHANRLETDVPPEVKAACDTIIALYTGDFLEDLLVKHPEVIDGETMSQSWAREPFTWYRDCYLQALFYAAEWERLAGDRAEHEADRRAHYISAGRLFVRAAMAACSNRVFDGRFDMHVYFAMGGQQAGPHVVFSEQCIRRAMACLGSMGLTIMVNKAYTRYEAQMLQVSGNSWVAHPETRQVRDAAIQQTGNYRFAPKIVSPYAALEPRQERSDGQEEGHEPVRTVSA